MSDEKSPARISHRHFATSRSEMESIMHKVQAKAILSAKNGMNIYRGCQHGCIYCRFRVTGRFFRYSGKNVKRRALNGGRIRYLSI